MKAIRFTLLMIVVTWLASRPFVPISHEPGVLISQEPRQATPPADEAPIRHGEWMLKPLAEYEVHARVLATTRYRFDAVSELSPNDLILGWGPMSDSAVLDKISFSQSLRFGYWSFDRDCPLPESEISRHAANTHIIPANDQVRERIASLRVGSLVRLQGKLVEATHTGGGKPWRSSLKRTDRGAGACEIIYVKSIREL
jgi:hypothetical protein